MQINDLVVTNKQIISRVWLQVVSGRMWPAGRQLDIAGLQQYHTINTYSALRTLVLSLEPMKPLLDVLCSL
jgi:hypothetical protein